MLCNRVTIENNTVYILKSMENDTKIFINKKEEMYKDIIYIMISKLYNYMCIEIYHGISLIAFYISV